MTTTEGTRQGFFQSVLEAVRDLPISELIRDKYGLTPGFCPFHKDKTAGSFSYVNRYNAYRCWSCQARGDGIQFVMDYERIPFEQAVMKIALLFDVINEGQAEAYSRGSGFEEVVIRKVRASQRIDREQDISYRASAKVIHEVLGLLAEGQSILDNQQSRLSEVHLENLSDRGLTEEDIQKAGYFSMPSRNTRYMTAFFRELKTRYGYEASVVEGVPGFYKMNEKPEGQQYTFVANKGIGIPICDAEGMIRGIQVRRDKTKKGGSRYIWLSSAFANEEDDLSFGTNSGSPIHVSSPQENRFPSVVFITEGVFKSEALAKTYSSTALSLQGIGSWKHELLPTLQVLEENEDTTIQNIYLVFDADIRSNIHVFEAAKSILDHLESLNDDGNLRVYYAWWDNLFGKGVDDLIQNGYREQMRKVIGQVFVESYERAIAQLEENLDMNVMTILEEFGTEPLETVFDEFVRPLFES